METIDENGRFKNVMPGVDEIFGSASRFQLPSPPCRLEENAAPDPAPMLTLFLPIKPSLAMHQVLFSHHHFPTSAVG
jgi:hypothetical protein